MGNELLKIHHAAWHLPRRDRLARFEPNQALAARAEQRLEHTCGTEFVPEPLGRGCGLGDPRSRDGQAGRRQPGQGQVFVDRHLQAAGRVDDWRPGSGHLAEQVHPEDHLLQASLLRCRARHAPSHDQISPGQGFGMHGHAASLDRGGQVIPGDRLGSQPTGGQNRGKAAGVPAADTADEADAAAHGRAGAAAAANEAATMAGSMSPKTWRQPVSAFTSSTRAGAKRAGSIA